VAVRTASEQVAGDETHGKLEGVGLGDEAMTALGEDEGGDAGGGEIGQKVVGVVGGGGDGDGPVQHAVIVDDDGGQAPGALPERAGAHGRNSSRAL
jgi:hypothetical protein